MKKQDAQDSVALPFIHLAVGLFASFAFIWTGVDAFLVWRATGINTMSGDYLRFAVVGALGVAGVLRFRIARRRQRASRSALNQKNA